MAACPAPQSSPSPGSETPPKPRATSHRRVGDQDTPPDTPPWPRAAPAAHSLLPEAGPDPLGETPSAETHMVSAPMPPDSAGGSWSTHECGLLSPRVLGNTDQVNVPLCSCVPVFVSLTFRAGALRGCGRTPPFPTTCEEAALPPAWLCPKAAIQSYARASAPGPR